MAWKHLAAGVVLGAALVATAWAQTSTRKAYIVVQSDVTNPEQYANYTKVSPDIIAKHGGRFLARGGKSATLEGTTAPARIVVIEFPSYDAAQAMYRSPEYTAARKLRAGAATMQFVVVEGL